MSSSPVAPEAPAAVGQPLSSIPLGRGEFIAMIAAVMALNALAIDILLPAFPEIAASFRIEDSADASLLLVSYILGFGMAQPFWGPVADRYGRRTPLFIGGAAYAVCALAGLVAPSFGLLLVLRFLQGVGAASTRVIALAVVRDTMHGRAMASTMSLVMMVFMVVPVFAPMAGQLLVLAGDWHLVFVSMAVLCVATLLWVRARLPETLAAENRRPLTASSALGALRVIVTDRVALGYALATSSIFSALFAFLTLAQPIYVDVYGLGDWFSVAFGGVAVLMAVSSLANSRLVTRFGARRLSHGAVVAFLVLSLVLLAMCWEGNPPFWPFYLMIAAIMPLFGLVGANLNTIAMEPLGAVAGSGSAILGFLQSVVGAIVGAVIGVAFDGEVRILAASLVAVCAVGLLLILFAEKGVLFREID